MKVIILYPLLFVLGLCCVGVVGRAADAGLVGSRPNTVFFLSDDQSRFDYSAYGNEKVPTPTRDAFAKEAPVFDRAYTGQAICAPGRSMLYTGLHPIRNGRFINRAAIRPGVKALPTYLEKLDYEVILAGKPHVKPAKQFPWTLYYPPVEKPGVARPCIPIDEIGGLWGTERIVAIDPWN